MEPKNISHNGLKKILVIGKTGTGKSSLCNVLAGKEFDADYFPTSSDPTTCTQKTKFANVNLNGDRNRPVSVIDTIGFDDPTKDHDAEIIAELVVKLKTRCDYVNLFVLAVNGQNPRLDGSLLTMIRILEGMFSKQFWNQVVLVFTQLPMSERDKLRRERERMKTDDEFAADFIKEVEKQFEDCTGLHCLYMDATYDKNDEHEKAAFDSACTVLHEMLEDLPGLPTENVKQVETGNETLKRKIKEAEDKERAAFSQGMITGAKYTFMGLGAVAATTAEIALFPAAAAAAVVADVGLYVGGASLAVVNGIHIWERRKNERIDEESRKNERKVEGQRKPEEEKK